MENNIVLTMRGICMTFPGVKALENVDFTLRKGDRLAIIDKGSLLISGSMDEIRAKNDDNSLEEFFLSVTQGETLAEGEKEDFKF